MTRRPAIDQLTSLRFLAAVYVLVYHSGSQVLEGASVSAPLVTFLRNGYLGVSFFFALSGFILSYVYTGIPRTRTNLVAFAAARFSRIYPIYLLALIISVPLAWAPVQKPSLALATLLMVQSWGVTASPAGSFWNTPGWTLSVEVFFYLAFPLLLPVVERMTDRGLWLATILFGVIVVALALPPVRPGTSELLVLDILTRVPLPLLRLPEFVLGILAGTLFLRGRFSAFRRDWCAALAIIGTLAALASSSSNWVGGVAAIGFVAILASCAANTGLIAKLLSSKPLVLLGGASYSLYLLQTPIRGWISLLFSGQYEWLGRLLYQPTLLVISLLVFLFVEQPARRLLRAASTVTRAAAMP